MVKYSFHYYMCEFHTMTFSDQLVIFSLFALQDRQYEMFKMLITADFIECVK